MRLEDRQDGVIQSLQNEVNPSPIVIAAQAATQGLLIKIWI
jgi:hypothetical protein